MYSSSRAQLIHKATLSVDAYPYTVTIPTWAQSLRFTGKLIVVSTATLSTDIDLAPNGSGSCARWGYVHTGGTVIDIPVAAGPEGVIYTAAGWKNLGIIAA